MESYQVKDLNTTPLILSDSDIPIDHELDNEQNITSCIIDILKNKENSNNALQSLFSKIYFVLSPTLKLIKIGTTKDVNKRLKGLQSANSDILVLLYSCYGGPKREKEIHEQFKKYRKHGEWFEYSSEIEEYINGLVQVHK